MTKENSQLQLKIDLLCELLNEVNALPITQQMNEVEEERVEEDVAWYFKGKSTGNLEVKAKITQIISTRIAELTTQFELKV